ncbi:MAG: DUF368 domain-containing protein [Ruminococcaceae bacterium]|nr:DUF368 domain-containing protein [Oscillospiraceae bacterium]
MPKDRNFALRWLRDLLCGLLIGAGAILPGVSGGVLAVVFDIYRPMMEVLTSPRTAIPKYWIWFPPIAVGWAAGFLGFAKGIAAAIRLSDTITTWLFVGLIVGTLPSLFREAGKEGRGMRAWLSLLLCAAAVFSGLFYVSRIANVSVTPNFWWYNFCGALWGMSVVIPGMTSSSVLMALGLYQPLLEGLASLDFFVLSASIPGLVLTVLLLARLVNWFFRRYYAVAFHGILGIVLASTVVIIPTQYAQGEALWSALCCVGGFLLAFLLAKLDTKV